MWRLGRSRRAAVIAAFCFTFGALLPSSVASAPLDCNQGSDAQRFYNEGIVRSLIQTAPTRLDRSMLAESHSLGEKQSAGNPRIHTVPMAQSLHGYEAVDVSKSFLNLQNVVQNNLGGAGPGSGPEGIIYKNVYELSNVSVDLVVSATTRYKPKNSASNGVKGAMGSINMAGGGQNTTFLFKFVDSSDHSKSVILNTLYMSFYDLDNDNNGLREVISTPYFDRAFLYENTAIETIERHGDQAPIFASTGVDSTGANNPDDPADLTPEQKQRTLTLRYLMVSQVEITFATWNGKKKSGRSFFFNGIPMFPACITNTETASLTFTDAVYSDFGNQGPDVGAPEGMRFKNVFQLDSGAYVDLLVSNIDGDGFQYVASEKSHFNGVRDGFGCINMETRAKAKFKFEFISSETDEPVTMKNLELTWLDLDGHPREPNFSEVLILGGFQDVYFTEGTTVNVTFLDDGTAKFASTEADAQGGRRNPTNPFELTPEQERRSVTVKYKSVQTFTAIIDLSSGFWRMSRNIYFHGTAHVSNAEDMEFCE